MAGLVAETTAALGGQVGALTGNWQGAASGNYGAASVPFAAWLSDMQAASLTNAATAFSVLESYGVGMATMVPLPIIIINRIAARTAQIAGVLGAPNTEMVRLELEYAAFWAHNAAVMTGYDVAVNSATVFKPVPPPPPLVVDGGIGTVGSAASTVQKAAQAAGGGPSQGASTVQNAMSGLGSGMGNSSVPLADFAGPSTSDSGMWSSMLGGAGGGGGGGGAGLGGAGGGGGLGGGGGVGGVMPTAATAAFSKPAAVMPSTPTPSPSFGGVPNAATATRPAMPMMPPMHPSGNRRMTAKQGDTSVIKSAYQEFPVSVMNPVAENQEQDENNKASIPSRQV